MQKNKCKICRREGEKLMLKGDRCLTAKCAFARRSYGPGQHGQNFRGKRSEYGKQLREKQKTRKIYGIDEQQFANYVVMADKMEGNNAANLMTVLELRLDNVIYRSGLAVSRSQARQFAAHGLFSV
ncbi:MAG: 30S ribosomal protein S4, partial [bacterium]